MEHFRSEIEEIISVEGIEFAPAVVDGKPAPCLGGACGKCQFKGIEEDCTIKFIKWLMSEYKEEPVLTAREKYFVEFVQEGWLARDSDGELWWYKEKPKRGDNRWKDGGSKYSFCGILVFDQHFRFITWEDEPWAVEELRKLKALEYNPEDVAFKKGGEADET